MPVYKLIKIRGRRVNVMAEATADNHSELVPELEAVQNAENEKWLIKKRGAQSRIQLIQVIAEGKRLKRATTYYQEGS